MREAPSRAARAPLRRLGSRLSRRGLLGTGVLAGVLAASGVAVAARPRGGVLRLGLAGPVPRGASGWDTRASLLAGLAVGGVAEALAEVGPGGELLPGLAAAWDADGAARHWRLRLAPGARFHDGSSLAPADVAASLLAHREGSPLSPLLARVEEVRPDGAHGLRLRLREGDPDLPLRLAAPRLAVWRDGRADGVGTGLYRLDPEAGSEAEGAPLRLLRVAGHRRDGAGAAAGLFEAVEAWALPDPRARLDALLAGRVDAVDLLPPELAAEALAAGLALAGEAGEATAHGPRVAHGPVSAVGPLDGGRIAERWWLA